MDKKYICEHMSYIHVRETGRIANPEGDMVLKPFTTEVMVSNGYYYVLAAMRLLFCCFGRLGIPNWSGNGGNVRPVNKLDGRHDCPQESGQTNRERNVSSLRQSEQDTERQREVQR